MQNEINQNETTNVELERDKEAQALDDLLRSPKQVESFVYQVKRLADDVAMQKARQDDLNEDIKSSAEFFQLSSATFKTFINAVDKGNLDKLIDKGTSVVDAMTILKEKV